jgi:8-oxo-dGTP diphosphatase
MSLLTSAVAAIIRDSAGRVLLCQQSQGHRLWGLPGGKIRTGESPIRAVVRDIREEIGAETEVSELLGLYQLTGDGSGADLPDVLMYVFRARLTDGDVAVNSPGRICRLAWHELDSVPEPLTATARAAIADMIEGRNGVVRDVRRHAEPEIPEAEIPEAESAEALATAA